MGKEIWYAHYELGIKIVDNQTDWTPLQKRFLFLATDYYGPDNSELPNP